MNALNITVSPMNIFPDLLVTSLKDRVTKEVLYNWQFLTLMQACMMSGSAPCSPNLISWGHIFSLKFIPISTSDPILRSLIVPYWSIAEEDTPSEHHTSHRSTISSSTPENVDTKTLRKCPTTKSIWLLLYISLTAISSLNHCDFKSNTETWRI